MGRLASAEGTASPPDAGVSFPLALLTPNLFPDSMVTEKFWHLTDREVMALGP